MPDSEPEDKKKMWMVDPSIFTSPGEHKTIRRVAESVKTLAKLFAFALLVTYPLGLVILGLVFGWVVFWGSFAASFLLLGLTLSKFGYSRNFASWNPHLLKQLATLTLGFLAAAGFYIGLFTFKAVMFPILLAIFLSALVFGIIYKEQKS